jgi:hypothetical protein
MTPLLSFLPLYVELLGMADHAAIVQWSTLPTFPVGASGSIISLTNQRLDARPCQLGHSKFKP